MSLNRTILLVDDDHDDYEIFNMALAEAAPSVTCIYFDSAKEALKALSGNGNIQVEYIFLDLNMPGMNGIQFLENLQNVESPIDARIIVYSTSILPSNKEKVIELGAADFFIKPYSHLELINILKTILASKP